jgi:hypothetical protein
MVQVDADEAFGIAVRLEELLLADDYQANELMLDAIPQLQVIFGEDALKLEREIRSFDYPRALATLRAAMGRIEDVKE